MKQESYAGDYKKQQGVAFPIVMVIMVLSAVIVLYLANTSKKEQQISADQYRTEQSLNAAMAGVDWAVDYYNTKGLDDDDDDIVDYRPDAPMQWYIGDLISSNVSRVNASGDLIVESLSFFCNSADEKFWKDPENCKPLNLAVKEDYDNVGIVSIGYSDDNTARRVVTVKVASSTPLGKGVNTPMTSHGQITSGGNFTLINRYYNYNAWLGDKFLYHPSSATESYVLDPKLDISSEGDCDPASSDRFAECNRSMMIAEGQGNTIPGALPASSSNRGNNFDIVDMDPSLSQLGKFSESEAIGQGVNCKNDNTFFCAFFSAFSGPEDLRKAADGIGQIFTTSDCDQIPATDTDDSLSGVIYVEGRGECTLNKGQIGKEDAPAIIFIDGDVSFTGDIKIYGLLYVTGLINIKGTVTIIGSSLSEDGVCVPDKDDNCSATGSGGGGGNGTFIFDLFSLNPKGGFNGFRGIVPNTWRDWELN